MNPDLNTLYRLQTIDVAIATETKRFRALDTGDREREAIKNARETHDEAVTAAKIVERDLQAAELELQSVEGKTRDFARKRDSGKISNWKELESIQMEIDALGRQRSALDDRILHLMDGVTEAREVVSRHAAHLAQTEADLVEREKTYKREGREIAVKIRGFQAERETAILTVTPALLKKYDTLKPSKAGVVVSRILEDRCTACRTSLPSETIEMVEKTDKIMTCDNCGRMLCVID